VAAALFLMGWFYFTYVTGHYLSALVHDTPFYQRAIYINFVNIRFFNQFQSWTLSLMVLPLLLFPKRASFMTALFIAVAVAWWLLLFASGVRGTLVGSLVAIPFTLWVFGKQAKQWFKWQVVAMVGGLAGYFFFFFVVPEISSLDVQNILANTIDRDVSRVSDRWELWSVAGKMAQEEPWLGAGPMQYAALGHSIAAHPHNSLLQIAAEWGLPVALAVIALFILGLIGWAKIANSISFNEKGKNIYAALFASLMTAAVNSLFCGIIVMPLSQVMMVLVIGWMLGISVSHSAARRNHSKLKHAILCLIFPFAIYGVIWPLFPEVLQLEKSQAEFRNSHPKSPYFRPRFWLQGYLIGYNQPFPSTSHHHDESSDTRRIQK
jgi:O-antigen ligase